MNTSINIANNGVSDIEIAEAMRHFKPHYEEPSVRASEAVYGFAAWLTTREERTIFSSTDECAGIPSLCDEYITMLKLTPPREDWGKASND